MDARQVTLALGGRWRDGQGVARCPVDSHGRGRGDTTPSLSIAVGRGGRLLVHCHAGCAPRDVLAAVRDIAGGAMRAPVQDPAPPRARLDRIAAANRFWSRTWPVPGTLAARYLAGRGLDVGGCDLGFAAAASHPQSPLRFPVLAAALRDRTGRVTAVQRLYLSRTGGKADIRPLRAMLGAAGGSAVRLSPWTDGPLGLAEGVETALSAARLSGLPVWAACGARLHRVDLPADVNAVVLFADHDPPGLATALRAAARLRQEGRSVTVRRPIHPGHDFNDVLTARAARGVAHVA